MALTPAEKQKRYRERKKEEGKHEEMKAKHANTMRKSRKKADLKLKKLPLLQRIRVKKEANRNAKERNSKSRRLKKLSVPSVVTPIATSPAYKNSSTLGKAKTKLRRNLPTKVKQQLFVLRELYVGIAGSSSPPLLTKEVLVTTPRSSAISEENRCLIINFFIRDDISRQAPGMKDVVTVRNADGSKEKLQIRHLLSSLKETFALFCLEFGKEIIKKSKFAELRPKHVMLSSKLPHNVCLCKYHENFIASIIAVRKSISEFPEFNHEFPELWLCKPASNSCWDGECQVCVNKLSQKLDDVADEFPPSVTWCIWKEVDGRLNKVIEEGSGQDLIVYIKSILPQFFEHCHVKREQAKSYQLEREDAGSLTFDENRALLQVDFSENYTCEFQDEIQTAHWNQRQVSLFTIALWHSGVLHPIVLASDNICHSKDTVVAHIDRVLEEIPSEVKKVSIWSDGPSSQFKNKFIAASILHLQNKHGKVITWNFFATSHGKGPVDGIGGAIKRKVWSAVKSRKDIVTNAAQFVDTAKRVSNVQVDELSIEEINQRNLALNIKEIFEEAKAIPGIKRCHMIQVQGDAVNVHHLTKLASCSAVPIVANSAVQVGDWYEVDYDGKLYKGTVTQLDGVSPYKFRVKVMSTVGKNHWKWPEHADEIFYKRENLVRKLNPPTMLNARQHYEFK